MRVHVRHGLIASAVALLCVTLASRSGSAQRLTGVVVEDVTRRPVSGAYVVLMEEDGTAERSMLTDTLGEFGLDAPRPGTWRLRVDRLGYQTYTSPLIPLQRGESISVEVRLGPDAIPLEPIVVTAYSGPPPGRAAEFHQRRHHPARNGTFITRDDIERSGPGGRASDVLVRVPAVSLVPVCPSAPCTTPDQVIRMRGSAGGNANGVCEPAVYLDGVPVHQTSVGIDARIDPAMLEGVEVYSSVSAAPIQYAMGNDCGVILFWTRIPETNDGWGWKRLAAGAAAVVGMTLLFLFR